MAPTIHTNGVHHEADEAIDSLYAWMPPSPPAQALPEATFSLTLKSRLDGQEALLTVRGQTAEAFKANLQAIRGLLDQPAPPPVPPAPSQDQSWCAKHGIQMQRNTKEGRSWWSHKTAEGWCKGK
jgi:hypothetical protein